jgi:CHAD domain-containing protein
MNVGEAFAAAAHASLRHFRLNEPLILGRSDAEALHQARVAIRRLRSALAFFRPAIADWEYDRMRDELRRLAGELGEARNLDVLLERLPAKRSGKAAREKILRKREAAYGRVRDLLDTRRARTLMLNLVRWFETGGWRARPRAGKPFAPFAAAQRGRRWKRISHRGTRLAELDARRLHALRIDVKKMRYAAEFAEGLYPSGAAARKSASFIEALKALQDRLGEINDAETGRDMLGAMKLGKEGRLALAAGSAAPLEAADRAFAEACASAGYWS